MIVHARGSDGADVQLAALQGADGSIALRRAVDQKDSIPVSVTVQDSGAYTTGHVVGGLLSVANAVAGNERLGVKISGIILIDNSGTSNHGAYDLVMFDGVPTSLADNAAYALDAAGRAKVIGYCPLNGPWCDDANGSFLQQLYDDPVVLKVDTTLRCYLVTRFAGPTFAATTGQLVVKFLLAKD